MTCPFLYSRMLEQGRYASGSSVRCCGTAAAIVLVAITVSILSPQKVGGAAPHGFPHSRLCAKHPGLPEECAPSTSSAAKHGGGIAFRKFLPCNSATLQLISWQGSPLITGMPMYAWSDHSVFRPWNSAHRRLLCARWLAAGDPPPRRA